MKKIMLKNKIFSILVTLMCVGVLFYPGLMGLFMLDDVANLQLLFNTIQEKGFWLGVFDGRSGPLGRPLSLYTFALQQESWPNDPVSFKRINLIIHLINTGLMMGIVYWLLPHLFSISTRYQFICAVLLAGFWAALPIQVSTVLYVVQRMVLLSSLFMLLAIAFYIRARFELCRQHRKRAVIIFCIGVGASVLLSILAKESGLLVFAFLLVVEFSMQKNQPITQKNIRRLLLVVLALPLILFVGYILYSGAYHHYETRNFNLLERALTQSRVLVDYVRQILLPVQSQLGLYHDDYSVSKSFLNPISTLYSIVFWLYFCAVAIWAKFAHKPWMFFGFFWFISGHLMESTILPLELYFEHRNYLSSLGILVVVIGLAVSAYAKIGSSVVKNIMRFSLVAYLAIILSIAFSQISLWGNKAEYMVVSAKEHPHSLRARMLMIDYYDAIGSPELAYKEIELIMEDFPNELSIALSKLLYACEHNIPIANIIIEDQLLLNGRFSNATEATLLKLIDAEKNQMCSYGYTKLLNFITGISNNKNYQHAKHRILKIGSFIHFLNNDYKKSIDFLESIEFPDFEEKVGLVRVYAFSGNLEKAQIQLNSLQNNNKLNEYEQKVLTSLQLEIDRFRSQGNIVDQHNNTSKK
jgi:protein O-mannosyl-transferase